jgi:hypothetical protein
VGRDEHYTKITVWNLNRNLQKRTEETIKATLALFTALTSHLAA